MTLPEKLSTIILADVGITTKINNKLFPIFATQGAKTPAVCYEIEEEQSEETVGCIIRNFTVALHTFSTVYGEAFKISDLLIELLRKFNDAQILHIKFISSKDIPEGSSEEGEGQIFHRESIFHIQTN